MNAPDISFPTLYPEDIKDLKVGIINQLVTTWAKTRWRDCRPFPDFQETQGACSVSRNAERMIRTLQDVDVIDALEIFAVYVEAAASLTGGDQ